MSTADVTSLEERRAKLGLPTRVSILERMQEKQTETLALLQQAVGLAPDSVTGEKGSGLMLVAVELLEERKLHRKRLETGVRVASLFGGVVAAAGAVVGMIAALGAMGVFK